jgi:FkbM family methyltransferase
MADEFTRLESRARLLEEADRASASSREVSTAPVVLYGAGPLGQLTLQNLRHVGIEPVAFADGNPRRWQSAFEDVPILSPEEAVRRHGGTARFVVTIYNGSAVRRQLVNAGVGRVSHFADVYFEHAAELLPLCGIAPRSIILDAWDEVTAAAGLWHDARSEAEYRAQIGWRLRLENARLAPHDDPAECYFPQDLFAYRQDEVLFDCGAYDGDSLRQYLARSPASGARKIVAFEPDAGTFARLSAFVAGLDPAVAGCVRIEPWAVADTTGEVRFSALGSVRSGVADEGGATVHAVALDDLDVAPTLVKMDVEGFELRALKGAARHLTRDRPVLAISLYHHASDLWSIPIFLKKLIPDYNLHLRRYAEDCWEVVLYAIPASRMMRS